MRLGDLDALKEAIIEPLNVNDVCKNDWYEGYYTAKNEDVMAIDNAKTVKSFTLEDIEGVRAETIKMMENRYARPQGEWIKISAKAFKCKDCNYVTDIEYPYCPICGNKMVNDEFGNCGADMRKDGSN